MSVQISDSIKKELKESTDPYAVIRLVLKYCGMSLEQIAITMLLPNINPSQKEIENMVKNISRISKHDNGDSKRHMSIEMFIKFMIATKCSWPLEWIYMRCGWNDNSNSVTHDDLLTKIDSLENLFIGTMRYINHAARRSRSRGLTARMSLAGDISMWLINNAQNIQNNWLKAA